MNDIVIYIRDCKDPKCGHDRSSHYQSKVVVFRCIDGVTRWVEEVRPMPCLARGCTCMRFRNGDASDKAYLLHKDVYDKDQEQKVAIDAALARRYPRS